MTRRSRACTLVLLAACSDPLEGTEAFDAPVSLSFPMGAGGSRPSENAEEKNEARDSPELTITRVRGLYEHVYTEGGAAFQQQEVYQGGDDSGRVYTDRDLEGRWANGSTAVEVTVRVRRRSCPPCSRRRLKCVLEHYRESKSFERSMETPEAVAEDESDE